MAEGTSKEEESVVALELSSSYDTWHCSTKTVAIGLLVYNGAETAPAREEELSSDFTTSGSQQQARLVLWHSQY
jgi:hypothetical protein